MDYQKITIRLHAGSDAQYIKATTDLHEYLDTFKRWFEGRHNDNTFDIEVED